MEIINPEKSEAEARVELVRDINSTCSTQTTYHKSISDLGSHHAECEDVQRRVVLVHVRLALLEDDEGRHHHQREGDHRRQDARALRSGTVYRGLWRGDIEPETKCLSSLEFTIQNLREKFMYIQNIELDLRELFISVKLLQNFSILMAQLAGFMFIKD